MDTWKCKKCNHFNTTTAEEKKKAKRNYAIANTALTILSGGMWFLILLIKDCFLFSFDTAGGNGNIQGAGKQKEQCKSCGTEK